MFALHKLTVGELRSLCDKRERYYSGCNKKQPIAMLKEAEKEKGAQMFEEGEDDECHEGNDSQAENVNAASDG